MNAVVAAALGLGLWCAQPQPADLERDAAPAPGSSPSSSRPLAPFVDTDLVVLGYRGRAELQAALAAARPQLDACPGDADGALVVDFTVYAKGPVDRAVVRYDDAALDDACVIDIVRHLPLSDRGKEPPSRVVVRFARGTTPVLPLQPVQQALDAQAFSFARCVSAGAAAPARAVALRFDVDDQGRASNVQVSAAGLGDGVDETVGACAVAAVGEAVFAGGPGVGVGSLQVQPGRTATLRPLRQPEPQTLVEVVRALPCAF